MNATQQSKTVEIARRMMELGQKENACKAYSLVLQEAQDPALELEAALYLFSNGGDYKVSYTAFVRLYQRGLYQDELLPLLTGAFYEPNVKQMKARYEKNCKLLAKYPYLFRKDFLPFDQLPIQFFPFDDNGYLPFDKSERRFGEYVNFNYPKITRNFFKDLEKPILAADVFSAYELRYLRDNVRKSEYVARENHIYLHYTSWAVFCSYLQVINFRSLLEEEKFVFLIEDEISQYPIDFKERFGVDYTQYPLEPLHIREVNRLIWHSQLSAHNGGDFFNEIFDSHPNLIIMPSIMLDNIQKTVLTIQDCLRSNASLSGVDPMDGDASKAPRLLAELKKLDHATDKDILVFLFLVWSDLRHLDKASRIVPAVFLQPHFPNIFYAISGRGNVAVLECKEYEKIRTSPIFTEFPYIKTFTPMRRPTTSCAAAMKFMQRQIEGEDPEQENSVIIDVTTGYVLNRSYMIDPQDRLFQDSVLVRFEDGKLNPKATFTALAAFLDLPYTDSMTYCSEWGERDPLSYATNVRGFDPATVYREYEEYIGKPERCYQECFMREAYETYGYDFHYYDGAPMDADRLKDLVNHFDVQDSYVRKSWKKLCDAQAETMDLSDPKYEEYAGMTREQISQKLTDEKMSAMRGIRFCTGQLLLQSLRFVNEKGQPLKMMPQLKLDPDLLEQPLYH